MKQLVAILLALAGLSLLTACAGSGTASGTVSSAVETPEAAASARAEARWKAMIAKDLDKAYTYLSPGSKVTTTSEVFKSKIKPLDWRAVKVRSASCEKDTCRVQIVLTLVEKKLGGEVTTVFEENWLKDAGQWWLVFQ